MVIEATEVVEAVEVIEATKALDVRESLNILSASCHCHQKGINKPKTLETKFESCFTFVTFKLFFAKNFLELLHITL